MVEFRPLGMNARFIGIGEYYVGRDPMTTIGLGSCVALVLHNERFAVGAMAHIMLPESKGQVERPGKFADTAVTALLEEIGRYGSRNGSLCAVLIGGANMFGFNDNNLNIGDRNIDAVRRRLREERVSIRMEDVGGRIGRSVVYDPQNHGKITIRRADGSCTDL
ncbi:MAG: chemotaxis protein CheD [Methanofollis liminatans]|jgi:chemotaxis protein CheD|nr:chemotaxis protein CheD [Methanofollis liminatans]